jgi:hypothetical protein
MSLELGAGFFDYASASATSHVIVHNLDDLNPSVTVIDVATGFYIDPSTIEITDANTVTITFFVARQIRGRITKER